MRMLAAGRKRTQRQKPERSQHNRRCPQERERMVEHREGRFCPEDCVNPGDAKCARSNHRAERWIQRMPAAAQNARRYFIQIAQRLKEQDAQNLHACALNDRSIRRKKPRERISEQDNRKKWNRTAKQRQAQTQPQNAPTSPEFPGGVVLTGKGRRRLTERGNDVIGNVFKIHGYTRASCPRSAA